MDPSAPAGEYCTEAVVAYARGLFDAFSLANAPVMMTTRARWRRTDDNSIQPQPVTYFSLGAFAWEYPAGHPTETSVARAAIDADPDFAEVIGGMIGTDSRASGFFHETILQAAAEALVDSAGSVAFVADVVRDKVAGLRTSVRATERTGTAIIPLPGLKSGFFPITLEDGLEIDVLSDEEIDAVVGAGLLRPTFVGIPHLPAGDGVGVRIAIYERAYAWPKGTEVDLSANAAEATVARRRFGERSQWRLPDLTDDVLFALRLARAEVIAAEGVVILRHEGPLGESLSWHTRATQQHVRTQYEIDSETAKTIQDIWTKMRHENASRGIPPIATRRFNAAIDRRTLDDSIVDQLIAAEALILRDSGSPEERSELGFRLSLRVAVLLEDAGRDRRATFKFMKRAYDLRSRIAHGGELPDEVKIQGRSVPIREFVDELNALMRLILRKAIDEYAAGQRFNSADYWDDQILGGAS